MIPFYIYKMIRAKKINLVITYPFLPFLDPDLPVIQFTWMRFFDQNVETRVIFVRRDLTIAKMRFERPFYK